MPEITRILQSLERGDARTFETRFLTNGDRRTGPGYLEDHTGIIELSRHG
ncbi:MAG TPA: hypothetical protein VL361_13965 [Candidatus Limnocylindrales bacterium]|jgi:hypothetical protein|nr:hypothetical protein [Candidatus Limnocylindrales bacterium]